MGVILNAELFFKEATPLNQIHDDFNCNSLHQNYQLRKIALIVGGIFSSQILLDNINQLIKNFQVRPLKMEDIFFGALQISQEMLFSSPWGAIFFQNCQETLANYSEESLINNTHRSRSEIKKRTVQKFINQFEPELLNRYFRIKKVENSNKQKIDFLCKKLKGGCCFGYSMALLSKMKNHAKSSSNALKKSIDIENVIYYQLVNNVLWSLRGSENFSLSPAVYFYYQHLPEKNFTFSEFINEFEKKDEDSPVANENEEIIKTNNRNAYIADSIPESEKTNYSCKKESNNNLAGIPVGLIKKQKVINLFKHERLFFNFCDLESANIYVYDMEHLLKIGEMQLLDLSEHFNSAKQAISKQAQGFHTIDKMTMAGYFYIQRPGNKKQKGNAHAIFFQISDGYYRFYDSLSSLNKFFEFSDLEFMLKGIKTHMETYWKSYNNGNFKLILVGIPHPK